MVEETEREMLQSVFDLGDTIVREVMVPRTEVVWIEEDKTLRQALHLATRSGFSRIPVVGEDVDDVLGVAYIKDMIARALSLDPGERGPMLGEVMRAPVFVPESKNVDALLREMQRDRTHFAIVVDEYGGTAGIVTIEDLLEEIVGEITDEYDAETPAPIEPLPDGSYRVSARLPVEDLGELFDVELPDDDVDTVGGLLAQLLGRVPLPGSEASVNALHLLGEPGVDRRGRPRVQTLLVRRMSPAELGVDGEDDVPVGATASRTRPVKLDKSVKPEKAEKAERAEKADQGRQGRQSRKGREGREGRQGRESREGRAGGEGRQGRADGQIRQVREARQGGEGRKVRSRGEARSGTRCRAGRSHPEDCCEPAFRRNDRGEGNRVRSNRTECGSMSDEPLDPEDAKLVTLARGARGRTSALEGAAVRDDDGRTYAAATVALPSLRLTAVQAAVAAAVSSGAQALEAVAVVGEADRARPVIGRSGRGPRAAGRDHRRGRRHRPVQRDPR